MYGQAFTPSGQNTGRVARYLFAPGASLAIELLDNLGEDFQKGVPIGILFRDILAPVTVCGDVMQGVRQFDAHAVGNDVGTIASLNI